MHAAEEITSAIPGVCGVADARLRWLGHRLSVELTVATDPKLTVEEFPTLEHHAERAIRTGMRSVGTVRLSPTIDASVVAPGTALALPISER